MSDWKECPKCGCMNRNRESCQDCWGDLTNVAAMQPKSPAAADAKGGSHQRVVRPQTGEVWIHDKYGEVIILREWGNTACKVSVRATKSPAILFDANLHKKAEV